MHLHYIIGFTLTLVFCTLHSTLILIILTLTCSKRYKTSVSSRVTLQSCNVVKLEHGDYEWQHCIVRTEHYHHHFVAHYGTWSLVVIMKVTKCHIIINSSITTHNFLGGVLHTYDDTIWAPGTCCNDDSQDGKSYVHSGLRHQPRQRGGREPGQRGGALETDGEGTGHQLTWYLDMNLCAKYNWKKCTKIQRNTRRSICL